MPEMDDRIRRRFELIWGGLSILILVVILVGYVLMVSNDWIVGAATLVIGFILTVHLGNSLLLKAVREAETESHGRTTSRLLLAFGIAVSGGGMLMIMLSSGHLGIVEQGSALGGLVGVVGTFLLCLPGYFTCVVSLRIPRKTQK